MNIKGSNFFVIDFETTRSLKIVVTVVTQIQKLGPSIFASLPKFRHPWHTIASILLCFVLVFESEYRIVYCACSGHPQPSRRPLPCWKLNATSKEYFSWKMGRQWKNYRALPPKFHDVRFDLSLLLLLFFFDEQNNLRHNEGSPGILSVWNAPW